MSRIEVSSRSGDRFTATVRGHHVEIDQPIEAGGEDAGPTPTELFVVGLASCVAFYAGRFLRRHVQAETGFGVRCDFAMSEDAPARVASVDITVDVPVQLSPEIRAALQRAADHCTVHNSLRMPPTVHIDVLEAVPAAM